MDNNMDNQEKKVLPAQATGAQIKEYQDTNRNKYQTEYNVYHDKDKLTKDSFIVLIILSIVLILILLAILF